MEGKPMMKFFVVLFAIATIAAIPMAILAIALQSMILAYCLIGIGVMYTAAIAGLIICAIKGL